MCEKAKEQEGRGPDGLPYEMYKNGGEVVSDRMAELFNQVWEKERLLRMWNEYRVTVAQGRIQE